MKLRKKINISVVCYALAYAMFVLSLFYKDVSAPEVLERVASVGKYASVGFLIVGALYNAYTKKQLVWIMGLLIVDALLLIKTGVLLFITITLFTYLALNIKDRESIKIAFCTLIIYTVATLLLCKFGVFENLITRRWPDSPKRYTFGFYHSNVLPLIYSYLVAYSLLLMKKNMNIIGAVLLIIVDLYIYKFCGSRNALIVVILLVVGKLIVDTSWFGRIKNVVNKPLRIIAVVCIPVLTIATLGIALLLNKYSVLKKIDFICSYRFTYISMKIQKLGLSLLPAMTTNEYFKDEVVIDNGYAYVAIRYGIVMIIILSIIVCGLVKKYKNNSLVLGVIILVVIQNLIDNDLLDYSCLPFLILGLKNIVGEKKYGRIGKRNNECIQRNRIGTK